jgi:methylisocitrate lyase
VPICVLGLPIPGTAMTLHTGWGWMGAAIHHMKCARQLMETGRVDFDMNLENKNGLIDHTLYDDLITNWATKTGRPLR